jgi:hypothetical protein
MSVDVSLGHWTAADIGLIVVFGLAVAIVAAIGIYVVRASAREREGTGATTPRRGPENRRQP